jgi:hypothetical protein
MDTVLDYNSRIFVLKKIQCHVLPFLKYKICNVCKRHRPSTRVFYFYFPLSDYKTIIKRCHACMFIESFDDIYRLSSIRDCFMSTNELYIYCLRLIILKPYRFFYICPLISL